MNSAYLTPKFGLAQGFGDDFRYFEPNASEVGAAERVTAAAIQWLAPRRAKRVFLFVHYFDVHSDYRAPAEIERQFIDRRGPAEGTTAQLFAINDGKLDVKDQSQIARLALV